jgi:hypothetical protein
MNFTSLLTVQIKTIFSDMAKIRNSWRMWSFAKKPYKSDLQKCLLPYVGISKKMAMNQIKPEVLTHFADIDKNFKSLSKPRYMSLWIYLICTGSYNGGKDKSYFYKLNPRNPWEYCKTYCKILFQSVTLSNFWLYVRKELSQLVSNVVLIIRERKLA